MINTLEDKFSLIFTKLLLLLRFPVKRLSAAKEEPREKEVAEAVQETPPRRGRGRRRMKEMQLEGKREEEEISEEGLTQSLQKRDKNIQENKAMVEIPPTLSFCLFCPVGIRGCLTSWFCCCVLAGQALCRSEHHHGPAEVLHPSGWHVQHSAILLCKLALSK